MIMEGFVRRFCTRRPWVVLAGILLATIALLYGGCSQVQVTHFYEHGALATAAPIASEMGRQVFEEGGNAFDAAVAVAFALAVVHPEAGNIGGGGFALLRKGGSGEVFALDFRETAPAAATEHMYLDDSGNVVAGLSTYGARSVGVPGTVAGIHALWSRFGSMPWEDLVGRAAVLADTGFIVDEFLANELNKHRDSLCGFDETCRMFFPDGRSAKAGRG